MNSPHPATSHQRTSPGTRAATGTTSAPPRPTSGRENSGLMFFFIGAAVLALVLVLFFNFLGPEGASRTGVADGPARSPAGETTGGPSPRGAESQPQSPGGPVTRSGNDNNNNNAATTGASTQGAPAAGSTPQAPDSQTPPGREGMGAPAGNLSGTTPSAPAR